MAKKNSMRVLIIHNQMKYYGGAELLIVELANWLTKRGIKNDILALSSSKEVEKALIDTKIITPENDIDLKPPGYKNVRDILKAIKVFKKKLKEISDDYDVINVHDFPTSWVLFPRIGKTKKPCVWFMNLPPDLYSKPDAGIFLRFLNLIRRFVDRIIVRNSIDVITVAETANEDRAKKRYGMQPRLIHFGVNYDFFSKGNASKAIKKWNLKNKFVVVQSGMICSVKNQFASVKAIEEVRNKIPNVILILAGKEDENYGKMLKDYIKEKGLERFVIFTGNLKREDLRDLYKAADVGLFPIGDQGGVLAPFECLCAETPIIVSEEIETASFIKNESLGTVTSNYSKALLDVYRNPKTYNQQAKKSSEFVKKNLSWEKFSDRMIQAFKDALKKYQC